MGEKVYRKVGGRYKEIGETFRGFPSDGVWLVTDGRRNRECITRLSDIPEIPKSATAFRLSMKNAVLREISQRLSKKDYHVSLDDIATIACDALAAVLDKEES